MKKNYFMLAAATMMFAACAETDLVNEVNMEEAPKAIGFDAFANKTTRAAINSATGLENEGEFTVWGWKYQESTPTQIFDEQKVTYDEVEGWGYTPTQYWDKTATSYKFYAVAPKAGDATYDITSEKKITISNVASGDANNATDYLIDREGVTVDNIAENQVPNIGEKIEFNFSHIMSKITVVVKHSVTSNATTQPTVVLTDLAMSGWNNSKGTFTQDKTVEKVVTPDDPDTEEDESTTEEVLEEWELTENDNTSGNHAFLTSAEAKTLDETNATNVGSYLMVPQTGVDLTFTISYKIGEETFLAHTGTIENQTWATNTHYTYTIIVGPDAIEFDVQTVNNWTPATPSEGTTIQ